jgi:hypothetical protein
MFNLSESIINLLNESTPEERESIIKILTEIQRLDEERQAYRQYIEAGGTLSRQEWKQSKTS